MKINQGKKITPNKKYSYTFNQVLDMAIEMDIAVYAFCFSSKMDGLWIAPDHNSKGIIAIDTYRKKGKKLHFIFAHELGHSILHRRINAKAYFSDENYHKKIEHEANEYASWLLREINKLSINYQ